MAHSNFLRRPAFPWICSSFTQSSTNQLNHWCFSLFFLVFKYFTLNIIVLSYRIADFLSIFWHFVWFFFFANYSASLNIEQLVLYYRLLPLIPSVQNVDKYVFFSSGWSCYHWGKSVNFSSFLIVNLSTNSF